MLQLFLGAALVVFSVAKPDAAARPMSADAALAVIGAAKADAANERAFARQALYRFVYVFTVHAADNDVLHAEEVPITAHSFQEAELIAGQVGNNLLQKYANGQPGAYVRRRLLRIE
jgi:hypothetical protein